MGWTFKDADGFCSRAHREAGGWFIGYNFDLSRPDADERLTKLGLSPAAVRSGTWPITKEQAEELRAEFPDDWPNPAGH